MLGSYGHSNQAGAILSAGRIDRHRSGTDTPNIDKWANNYLTFVFIRRELRRPTSRPLGAYRGDYEASVPRGPDPGAHRS